MADRSRREGAPTLFVHCASCSTLFLNVVGKSLVHRCGHPTGRVVTDSTGEKYIETEPAATVELPVRVVRRVVRL